MVVLFTPAREATASTLSAAYPLSISSPKAAARIASRTRALRPPRVTRPVVPVVVVVHTTLTRKRRLRRSVEVDLNPVHRPSLFEWGGVVLGAFSCGAHRRPKPGGLADRFLYRPR